MSKPASIFVVPDLTLNERDVCDLEMLLNGAFAPLTTYLNESDYRSVLDRMRLADGRVWPMPIVLAVPRCDVNSRGVVNLRDQTNAILAKLTVTDVFEPDVDVEMTKVLGTTDANHPYAARMAALRGCCYVSGALERSESATFHFDFKQWRMSPSDVTGRLSGKVLGFQTRNPLHRSHFELIMGALRESGAETLLLSPAVGPTQPGDVPVATRVRCYEKVLAEFPSDVRVELVLLPLAMRMAGPREAVWHAIIRKNYGCTHFVVGRDHAGPSARRADGKPFYEPYAAQELLSSVAAEIDIQPVFARNVVYCGSELGYLQEDKVPSGAPRFFLSGSDLRRMLENDEAVPEWFSFPSVLSELRAAYSRRGVCVYITGLPCSGKSTMALYLKSRIEETTRKSVTLLDADVIRRHLSKGLGFSHSDRSANVQRIGFVASEVVRHGGVCLVANIAPYADDRQANRELISAHGTYVELYLSTPVEVCEARDVKEFYRRAREGTLPNFTGVSAPYEAPVAPELCVDSSTDLQANGEAVIAYLCSRRLL